MLAQARTPVTWVLEANVFPARYTALEDAVRRAGHAVLQWNDDWWSTRSWPRLGDKTVLFHGSLGNAARIRSELGWNPGAYCHTAAFECSAWYSGVRDWLLHRQWTILPANALTADPDVALQPLGIPDEVFVRPNSPLKPFAGRVLPRDRITLEALDFGFYYDDPTIDVVVTPVRNVGQEWRYVVVGRRVVAGSAYEADGRVALQDDSRGEPWAFASKVAASLDPPEAVYVMDVCKADDKIWLLELNPFSGADLYACNPDEVVTAVSAAAQQGTCAIEDCYEPG